MSLARLRDLALAILAAWLGYRVFAALGLPAAPLTGSATAVTLAALAGLNAELPGVLRNAVILVLGVNIGTGITPDVVSGALTWPLSLAVLALCMGLSLMLGTQVLMRGFGFDRETALLASTPGHLSYVLGIAVETGRDVGSIAVLQSIRVLMLTLAVPPLVAWTFGGTGLSVLPAQVMGLAPLLAVMAVTVPVGFGLARLRVPAAFLLAGMAISALGHATGITPGRLPDALGLAAFLMMGTLIGSRFNVRQAPGLHRLILPGLAITATALAVAAIGVLLCALALGVPPGLLVVAFAPGGVEAMAAIALSLGYDPAFVAAHHVFRLLVLSALVPLMLTARRD